LPKNLFLADWLLKTALERKYQEAINLEPLDDQLAEQARSFMLRRLGLVEAVS